VYSALSKASNYPALGATNPALGATNPTLGATNPLDTSNQ